MVRSVAAILFAALAGCAEGPDFDPCATSEALMVLGPEEDDPSTIVLVADAAGYVVFWNGSYRHSSLGPSGVFAVRPGGDVVHVVSDRAASHLGVTATADGFVVCFTPGRWPPDGECVLVDEDLDLVGEAERPAFTANPFEYPYGGCALGPAGWACLLPSDPRCSDTWAPPPPGCAFDLHVADSFGAEILLVEDVAPHGSWPPYPTSVAARPDGYLVAWTAEDWNARAIGLDGVVGPVVTRPADDLHGSRLMAVPSGYVAVWSDGVAEGDRVYDLPRAQLLSPRGELVGDLEWLGEIDPRVEQQGGAIAAVAGDGFALAWRGTGGAVFFRAMGCPQ